MISIDYRLVYTIDPYRLSEGHLPTIHVIHIPQSYTLR